MAIAAIVERSGEACIDAQPLSDLLMMAVGVVRAARDQSIDVGRTQACILKRVCRRFGKQVQTGNAGDLTKPAVARARNGTTVAQALGGFNHDEIARERASRARISPVCCP